VIDKPLSDITIVDLTHVLAGPFATMGLADLGATVIKVERPPRGDTTRATPPQVDGFSAYYGSINRNKYSVAIDLKQEQGQQLIKQLAAKADVLVHSLRPGVVERLGLAYDDLRGDNERLVYCSVSGFGKDGSHATRPAFDSIIQAMSGVSSLTGEPGTPPMKAGLSIGDLGAGLYAMVGILAALRQREVTGVGQEVEVSMFDALFNLLTYYVTYSQVTGAPPPRSGDQHTTIVPMGMYPASDGYLAVAAFNQNFWRNLCHALDRETWIGDPRFKKMTDRAANREVLTKEIAAVISTRTVAEWETRLAEFDVPFGPILTIPEVLAHPLVAERELLAPVRHGNAKPDADPAFSVAVKPVRYSGFEQEIVRNPPVLGEDTQSVLAELLGLDGAQIAALVSDGIVASA
jgi:crotonobetainyl-CoA:carnitine CoA-transferase CaiB-like acyl-CoA transferase